MPNIKNGIKALCDQGGFRLLWLMGFYYRWQGDLQVSHQAGTQLLDLAVEAEDPSQ